MADEVVAAVELAGHAHILVIAWFAGIGLQSKHDPASGVHLEHATGRVFTDHRTAVRQALASIGASALRFGGLILKHHLLFRRDFGHRGAIGKKHVALG